MLKLSLIALFCATSVLAAEKITCDFKGGFVSKAFKQTVVFQTSDKDKFFQFKRDLFRSYFKSPKKYSELFEGMGIINYQTSETEPTAQMYRAVVTPYFLSSALTEDGRYIFNYGLKFTKRPQISSTDRLRIFFASSEVPFEMSSNGIALYERTTLTGETDRFITPGGWGFFNCERLP